MLSSFFFNDTAATEIYTLSLHDALPISQCRANHRERHGATWQHLDCERPRNKSAWIRARYTGLSSPVGYQRRSEEHTSELQSRQYLVCRLLLEKKHIYHRRCSPLRHFVI